MTSEYTAIPVRLHAEDLAALIRGSGKIRKRRAPRFNTFTLTAANPAQLVLPQANNRLEAWVTEITAQQLIEPANPAASGGFSVAITQPCQLETFSFLFTASSTVANRFLNFSIQDAAGNVIYKCANNSAIVASTNVQWSLAQGSPQVNNAAGAADAALPLNLTLQPGWTLNITVTAEQTGDQISAIAYTLTSIASGVLAKNLSDAQTGGGSAIPILALGTPQPVSTTDQVWAGTAFAPTVIGVLAIYEEDE